MTNNVPLVSVITPSYNSSKLIAETIDSLKRQTYTNWECLVIDNGSQDNTIDIVTEISSVDSRVKLLISNINGTAAARQFGIENAQGKYIAFLDADDIWHTDKLEKQVAFMEESNINFSYHPYEYIDEDSKKIGLVRFSPPKISYSSQLRGDRTGCLTVMVRKSALPEDTSIPNLRKRNDAALFLRILKTVKYGYLLDSILASYRLTDDSLSSGSKFSLLKYHYQLYRYSEKFSIFKSLYYVLLNVLTYVDIKLHWEKKQPKA